MVLSRGPTVSREQISRCQKRLKHQGVGWRRLDDRHTINSHEAGAAADGEGAQQQPLGTFLEFDVPGGLVG
jgi:hypothetical protein